MTCPDDKRMRIKNAGSAPRAGPGSRLERNETQVLRLRLPRPKSRLRRPHSMAPHPRPAALNQPRSVQDQNHSRLERTDVTLPVYGFLSGGGISERMAKIDAPMTTTR
jgi:hypothetical protein